jgi:hypothetical protein
MIDHTPILLRQLLIDDLKAELADALAARDADEPPSISLGFQFWHQHHPVLLQELPDLLEAAWREVLDDIDEEIGGAFRGFVHRILPVIPHPADGSWTQKAHAALSAGHPTKPGFNDPLPPAPLAVEDLMRPYPIDTADPLNALLRMYPLTFRAHNNARRHPCSFAHWSFEFGPGWLPIMNNFAAQLEALCAELKSRGVRRIPCVLQAKEKFGSLVIHLSGYRTGLSEELSRLRAEAEERSCVSCMQCGAPGVLRKSGWHHVYCDACEADLARERASE